MNVSMCRQSFTFAQTSAEVSSSAPHFLHKGLSLSPIMWRCLLKVLCPVSRPLTTLDCVLLKDSNLVLAAVRGPEINSRACLWVPASPCLLFPILATYLAHFILLDLIVWKIICEEYRSWSSSLWSFLQSAVTSSLLGPNMLLSTLFS
jgi:hypothetical protein